MTAAVGVIGGSGLLSHAVWRAFAQSGDASVRVFARRPPADLPDTVAFTRMDLSSPHPIPAELLGCDVIVNAASSVGGDIAEMRRINVEGVQTLADAAAISASRWLQLSTAGVYGTLREQGRPEGGYPLRPESELSKTRAEGDLIAAAAGATILRPLFVTGRGDTRFLPPLLRAHAAIGAWIDDGAARLSVMSARDVGGVAVALARHLLSGRDLALVHAVPREPVSVRDLLEPILHRRGIRMTASITVDEARARSAEWQLPRRKVEQFARDYYIASGVMDQVAPEQTDASGLLTEDDIDGYAEACAA